MKHLLILTCLAFLVSCDAEPQDMNPKLPGTHKGSSIGGDGEKDSNKVEDVNHKTKSW